MTAAEWDTAGLPSRMLRAHPAAWDRRKVRLFWAACMRRANFAAAETQIRLLAALIENDPNCTGPRLAAEAEAARQRLTAAGAADAHPEYWSLGVFADSPRAPLLALVHHATGRAVERALWDAGANPFYDGPELRHAAEADEVARQCGLIREVFGNPFRPIDFSPWRTATAVALARELYDHREYSGMPILADALQDAGCEDELVLNHCRDEREHVRGCWVLDGVLGQ